MRTRKITREYVRRYVPILRRSRDDDLMVYWLNACEALNDTPSGRMIRDLSFREMMRRKRKLDNENEVE